MCISAKRIEKIAEKYDVEISLAPGSGDVLNIGTNSIAKFSLIAAELAWDDQISSLKMVMAGDR